MKKNFSLLACVLALVILIGVGTVYASRESTHESKKAAVRELLNERDSTDKENQDARKERNTQIADKDNTRSFEAEKKFELRRIENAIFNINHETERLASRAKLSLLAGRSVASVGQAPTLGLTSTDLDALKSLKAAIESSSTAEDLDKNVEALDALISPAKTE